MSTARDILTIAQATANDPRAEFWPAQEMLKHLNEALYTMVSLVPDQFAKADTFTLVDGRKQTITYNSALIIDIPTMADGTPLNRVDYPQYKAFARRTIGEANSTPHEWAYWPIDPKVFWVYPGAQAGQQVSVIHAEYPTELPVNGVIPVDPGYEGALVDYVLWRMFSKDADYANGDRASKHYISFKERFGSGESE